MATLTEKTHDWGFVLSEANGNRSRDNAVLASGQDLYPGAVLMKDGNNYTEVTTGDESDAVAILGGRCDASDGDTACAIIARDAEVNGNELVWSDESPAPDVDDAVAALLEQGIVVRF